MLIVKPEQHQAGGYGGIFLLNYGSPKSGKTRLCTSLPDSMLPAVYVAADPKAESLQPVLFARRRRLTIVKPGFRASKEGEIVGKVKARFFPKPLDQWMMPIDITDDFLGICQYPWSNDGFRTIIVDTISQVCMEALSEIAMRGWKVNYGEERHVLAKGTSGVVVSPNRSDYLLAQNFARKAAMLLADQPINVIVNAHQGVDDKLGIGGPSTVGVALLEEFTKFFDLVVSSSLSYNRKENTSKWGVMVKPYITSPGNIKMTAGIREATIKEVFGKPFVEISPDPEDFWHQVLRLNQLHKENTNGSAGKSTSKEQPKGS